MKLNYKVFKSLVDEPFLVQEINGKEVGFYYMNETPFLQQFVMRGRFYVWTSDGFNYKLLIEKGYYDKVSYFFDERINEVWLNFLNDVTNVNSKMSKTYMFLSLGVSLVIILLFTLIPFLQPHLTYGIIGALAITLIGNMIHSNKVNNVVREMNLKAQTEIKDILTEAKFNQFIEDQNEYAKEYFAFDEEDAEEYFDEDVELIGNEIEEVEVVEESVDYNNLTVAELKALAKERELTGYSDLKKAELIEFLKENEEK